MSHASIVVRRVSDGVFEVRYPCATLPPFASCASTVIVDEGQAAWVDPGWTDPAVGHGALDRLASMGVTTVAKILLTHTHRDHVAGLQQLISVVGPAPVHVHPLERDVVPVPRGVDLVDAVEGSVVDVGSSRWATWHLPGHAPGHLAWIGPSDAGDDRRGAIVGDLVTGRGAAWIGTPYGDASAYLGSLRRVRDARPRWMTYAHGDETSDPRALLDVAIEHRVRRAAAIVDAIAAGTSSIDGLLERIHPHVDDDVRPWALASLRASLDAAEREGTIVRSDDGALGLP